MNVEIITHAKLEKGGRLLVISVGDSRARFTAPRGKFWQHLVLAGNKRRAFVALKRGSPHEGWFHEDVHEFSVADFTANPETYNLRPIPLVSDLDDASVQEILAASEDGKRLLVSIHYCHARRIIGTFYRWHPYYFDTRTGRITLVAP